VVPRSVINGDPVKGSPGAAVVGGVACGGLWMLLAATILEVAHPSAMTPLVLGPVALLMGLAAAALCWRPGTPRQIWARVALTVGFHALALPVAAALSFAATGIWPPPETADLGLNIEFWGVRLVGTPTAVRLGVAGFVGGLLLVMIGDRALGGGGAQERMRRAGRLYR
jgi:hypothetical protein